MDTDQPTTAFTVLARIFWMFAGPMTLALIAVNMTDSHQGWQSTESIAFLVVLAAVIAARFLDPRTSDGNTTTSVHRTRFAAIAGSLGLAAWVAANWLGSQWLGD